MSDQSYSVQPFNGKTPIIADDVFIADGARIIGDVEIGAGSSIWFNVVMRGDVNIIRVGERSNIQDGSVVHVTRKTHGTFIGNDCLIGHMAMIHGCTLKDFSFVGLGAIVMDGCTVESDAMLAAGAMLTPGKTMGAGELWAGRPARFVRPLTEEEKARNRMAPQGYAELAQLYRAD